MKNEELNMDKTFRDKLDGIFCKTAFTCVG